jgi:phage terminase large subunit-like protein
VVNRVTGATLKVMTFDMKVATGGKFAGWLLDELHLLGKAAYTSRVIGQLRGARTSIREAFGVIITTQSDEPPAGAFKAELDYARGVRDGRIENGTILPVLYEFPEAMQTDAAKPWRDVANWARVLPNLGRSISLQVLEQDYATARQMGEEEERRWASQHLNIEIGLALHSNRWEGADHWERAGRPSVTLDWILSNCEVCTVGIDGGGLDDLLGLSVIGRQAETKRWFHWGHAWVDRGVLLLRKEIASRLQDFEKSGDLTFVDLAETATGEDGDAAAAAENEDVRDVADIVDRIFKAGLLPEKAGIGVDAVGIAAILDALALRGIPDDCIAAVPQGYRLSGVIKGAARKLKDGTLKHGGRGMMAWAVGNCRSELRGSAVLVTKQASGTAKIDPVIALFNAFDLMSRNPEAHGGPSVYEARGILMV